MVAQKVTDVWFNKTVSKMSHFYLKFLKYCIMRKITIKPNVTICNFCLANKLNQGNKKKTLQIV